MRTGGQYLSLNMDSNSSVGNASAELREDMEFDSHEDAYSFYKEYAKSVGFGTAKLSSRRSRASKEFIDAKFSCIRYGSKQQSDDAINPRPSPKIGCKASMHVKRKPNGKWTIYSFVKEHNHELLPSQAHFFRSHRSSDLQKNDIRARRRKNAASVSNLFGAYQNVECLEGYMRSQHDKGRKLILDTGDAQLLLELFMNMQEENPKFFYAVDFSEEQKLRNLFWVDAKGMEDYNNFSDVVYFDTTYFKNKYKIPLVLFIGVNNHIQPILLGCALIADETAYTFVWLMQTWFIAMGELAPRVMLTDQNNAIKRSISAVFPETRHCFCLWNIFEMIPKKLEYLSLWHDSFMVKFNKCIYRSCTEEQFEKRWWKLLETFHLREVGWIHSLYEDRKYWAPTFLKDVSFAGFSTTARSECLISWFDKYVLRETSLKDFIAQYKVILEDRYEEEAKANFDAWHESPELKSPSPFEKQMSFIYTHEIFKKFQVEVLGAAACHLKKENEDEASITYSVKDFEDNQDYMVEWNELKYDIYCSCRLFEYKGYLCRHAIVVLQMSGVFSIPSKYVLQRWTNAARSRHVVGERLDELQSKIRRYNDLCRRAIILGEEGSLSQESYNLAACSIKEALRHCASVNNSIENVSRPTTSEKISTSSGVEEENQLTNTLSDKVPDPTLMFSSSAPKKIKDKGTDKNKEQEAQLGSITSHDGLHQMDPSETRPAQLPNMMPTQFHNVASMMFRNIMSGQLENVPPPTLPETQLPR